MEPTPLTQVGQRRGQNVMLSPQEAAGGRVDGRAAGGSVAAGWHLGGRSQSRTRVCSWLTQFTLCTTGYSVRSAGSVLARSRRLGWGGGHQEGRAGSSNAFLALREGRKCRWRLPVQKRGENSLNNGTELRPSAEEPLGPRAGAAVQSLQAGISSSVSFVYCSS